MNKKTYSIEISGVQNAQYAQRLIGNKCYHDFVGPDGFVARMEIVLEDLTVFHSIDARNVSRALDLVKAMDFTGIIYIGVDVFLAPWYSQCTQLFTVNLNQEQDN